MLGFVIAWAAIAALAWPSAMSAAELATPSPAVPAELTLRAAVQLSLSANPRLQSLGWEQRKADARTRQADARPNPQLSIGVESAAGASAGSEATLSVGQLLELGGKRDARVALARAEGRVALLDAEAERLLLIGDVVARFLEALGAERALVVSEEEIHAAEEASATNAHRVASGAAHPVEKRRADVELASLRLERTILKSEAANARARLSATWGEAEPRFATLAGSLDSLPALPNLDSLHARALGSPLVARWRQEREARQRRLDFERARRMPDVTPSLGVRRVEGGDHSLLGGISLPIPLFDRNRGSIEEATAALRQAPLAEAQARLELRVALAERHAELRRERDKIDALRREVLPEAARAFEEIRSGYERGRFSYLDLLEARRTWLRARREELLTLLDAHLAVADLERLAGDSLDSLSRTEGRLER
ncbi:MAG: TolC family protein [Candidatus Eisenbacteria bacterium]|nr:TolC family protein [Candidatus Eisenbacteria bacterium]